MKILTIIAALFLTITATAQKQPTMYKYVVMFGSIGTGTSSNEPLLKYIKAFKTKQKIKSITYYNIGPMGREGEYYMAFPLTELNKKQCNLFVEDVDKLALKMNERGNTNTDKEVVIETMSLSSRAKVTKKTL